MTLREKQSAFAYDVAQLILWVYSHSGWELTFGECYRTKEQQEIFFRQGKSRTMRSKHLTRLAIDLNLFLNGVYQQSVEAYRPLGEFWKGLDPEHHVWGGDWINLRDAVHFEYD